MCILQVLGAGGVWAVAWASNAHAKVYVYIVKHNYVLRGTLFTIHKAQSFIYSK